MFLHKNNTMAILLKTASIQVSSIQIMQVRVQNKGKSVWKSRYDGDVSRHDRDTSPINNQQRNLDAHIGSYIFYEDLYLSTRITHTLFPLSSVCYLPEIQSSVSSYLVQSRCRKVSLLVSYCISPQLTHYSHCLQGL